eukprot:COSAG01_NODE_4504_length_4970_cov_4.822008_4_plen_184_part_00
MVADMTRRVHAAREEARKQAAARERERQAQAAAEKAAAAKAAEQEAERVKAAADAAEVSSRAPPPLRPSAPPPLRWGPGRTGWLRSAHLRRGVASVNTHLPQKEAATARRGRSQPTRSPDSPPVTEESSFADLDAKLRELGAMRESCLLPPPAPVTQTTVPTPTVHGATVHRLYRTSCFTSCG